MQATWRLVCTGVGLCVGMTAFAQPYPNRPIRFIVPNPAGGGADTTARIIATRLSERLNQQIVIDNRPGAGGTIGLATLAKAPADGYTIGMGVTATLAISPFIYSKLSYDSIRDFAPVSLFTSAPLLLVVSPSSAVRSVSDLIALAKAKPELKEQFENEASDPVGSTPSQFAAFIKQEQEKWARVVKVSGARAE